MTTGLKKVWTSAGSPINWSNRQAAWLEYQMSLNEVDLFTMWDIMPKLETQHGKTRTNAQKERAKQAYKRNMIANIQVIEEGWRAKGDADTWNYGDLVGFIAYMRYSRSGYISLVDMSMYDHIQVSSRDMSPQAHAERVWIPTSGFTSPAA
jgi:hypothetical protein